MRIVIVWLALAGTATADEEYEAKKAQAYLKVGTRRLEENKPKEALAACKRGFEHKPLPELRECIDKASAQLGGAEPAKEAPKDAPKDAPPPETKVQAAPDKCPAGKLVTPATSGHCCWPEQVFSDDNQVCIGIPRCPRGFKLAGNDCVRTAGSPSGAGCPPGKVTSGGHCCWPEQVWGENGCIGVPACPRGYLRRDRDCLPRAQPPDEEQ